MKKIIIFLFAFSALSSLTGVCEAVDIQKGFGGIDWSTSMDQIAECEKVGAREGIQYCVRRDQNHTLLGEPAPSVLYGFFKDAFFTVFIRIDNDEAYVRTKQRLVERLGSPETTFDKEGVVSTLSWTEGHVRMALFDDRSENGFRLVYYYLPIASKAFGKSKQLFPPKPPKAKLFPIKKGDTPEAVRLLAF